MARIFGAGAAIVVDGKVVIQLLPALRVLREAGHEVAMLVLRGGDAAGGRVGPMLRAARVAELSAVYLSRATPVLTPAGIIGASLFEQMAKQLRRRSIREAVARADAVLLDETADAAASARLASAGPAIVWRIGRPSISAACVEAGLPRLSILCDPEAAEGMSWTLGAHRAPMRRAGHALAARLAGADLVTALRSTQIAT